MLLKCSVYSQGLGRSGNEYGPLTDNPDWSYAGKHKTMI